MHIFKQRIVLFTGENEHDYIMPISSAEDTNLPRFCTFELYELYVSNHIVFEYFFIHRLVVICEEAV